MAVCILSRCTVTNSGRTVPTLNLHIAAAARGRRAPSVELPRVCFTIRPLNEPTLPALSSNEMRTVALSLRSLFEPVLYSK